MFVVKNFFVTCGVCGCVHRVRVQAGFVNDYPVRYLCPQCRNRIDGAVHLDPSCALIDFNLDPGTVASMGGNLEVDFQSQRNSLNGPRVSAASATRK